MSERPLSTQHERDALDRHITGNYGEDQFAGKEYEMENGAVVLHSGGQDSSTCLAWAIDQWGPNNVLAVSIDYGQRHGIELTCARRVCGIWGLPYPDVLTMPVLSELGAAALTNHNIPVDVDATSTGNVYAESHGLPSTFVPGRNILFLTAAMAYAVKRGIYNVVTGICETDDAGYPDCRQEFATSMERTLRLALDDDRPCVFTPLIKRSKADTFELAENLGVLGTIIEHTHTCYMGERLQRWDWGYGCDKCGACAERKKGYEEFRRRVPA